MLPPLRSAHLGLVMALVMALAVTLGSGCRAEPAPEGITVLIEAPPDSLDSRLALTAMGQRLSQLLTPGLVTVDDSGRPVPDLAESFQELSPTLVEFTLRPGLTFHDGGPLTAWDVKATYDSVREPALASPGPSATRRSRGWR
ncbi:ABC transporter substrate-binding protein [Cystobacter fuscus]